MSSSRTSGPTTPSVSISALPDTVQHRRVVSQPADHRAARRPGVGGGGRDFGRGGLCGDRGYAHSGDGRCDAAPFPRGQLLETLAGQRGLLPRSAAGAAAARPRMAWLRSRSRRPWSISYSSRSVTGADPTETRWRSRSAARLRCRARHPGPRAIPRRRSPSRPASVPLGRRRGCPQPSSPRSWPTRASTPGSITVRHDRGERQRSGAGSARRSPRSTAGAANRAPSAASSSPRRRGVRPADQRW